VASGVESPNPSTIQIDGLGKTDEAILAEAIWATYDVRHDDAQFRAHIDLFEQLRGDYPLRREFPAYTLETRNVPGALMQKLELLGFVIK
jgi:erythronate-4-phosphate dehydrogenase